MNRLTAFLRPLRAIAAATYRELVRDRLLYGILVVALLVTSSSFFLAGISQGQDARILQNVGLAAIQAFTAFICIFTATTNLARDVERRVPYLLFPKPISRTQYVLGKYAGYLLLLLTTLAVLGGLFTLGSSLLDRSLLAGDLLVLGYLALEISLLVAVALLFASFTAPLNASLYASALLVIGHSLSSLRDYAAANLGGFGSFLAGAAYYLLPNLEKFDVRQAVLYHLPVSPAHLCLALLYWLAYVAVMLVLAVSATKQREV